MKYLLIAMMLFSTAAMADVYVITAPDDSVYSLSEQDDAVVPQGYKKDVIKDKNIETLALNQDISLYSYKGKKFSLDNAKVAKKNKDAQDAAAASENRKQARLSAINKLKALGLTDQELQSLFNLGE